MKLGSKHTNKSIEKMRNTVLAKGIVPPSRIGARLTEKHRKILRKVSIKFWSDPFNRAKRSNLLKGSNSPLWKNGRTKLKLRIRQCFKYRQWRSDIFTRDDFTCVVCGLNGCYIEADHYPIKFSEILSKYNIISIEQALLCEELWNINNGRTLCRACHDRTKSGRKSFGQ